MCSFESFLNFVLLFSDEGFQLSESSLRCLEQLCVLLVENYPRLHESFAHLCHRSLRSCMMAFVNCPDVLRRLQFCIGRFFSFVKVIIFDLRI